MYRNRGNGERPFVRKFDETKAFGFVGISSIYTYEDNIDGEVKNRLYLAYMTEYQDGYKNYVPVPPVFRNTIITCYKGLITPEDFKPKVETYIKNNKILKPYIDTLILDDEGYPCIMRKFRESSKEVKIKVLVKELGENVKPGELPATKPKSEKVGTDRDKMLNRFMAITE